MVHIKFERELHLDESTGPDFENFLSDVRENLEASKKNGCSVLAEERELIDVIIHVSSYSLRLRLSTHDVYVEGFKNEDRKTWITFKRKTAESTEIVFGSDSIDVLPFSCNYKSIETQAERNRKDTPLGKPQLTNAIITLAQLKSARESGKNGPKAILVVAQMISEAIRFKFTSQQLGLHFNVGILPQMHSSILDLITYLETHWEKLSKALLEDHTGGFKVFRDGAFRVLITDRTVGPNEAIQLTEDMAKSLVGILKYH